jgi:hypothetical protein
VRLDHLWFAKTRSFARAGLRNDRPIYLAALTYVLTCMIYIFARGSFEPAQLWVTATIYAQIWWQQYGFFFPLILAGIGWAHITLRLSQRRRLAYRVMFGPERIGRLLAGIVLLSVMVPFHTVFNTMKTLVPLDQGFAFDRFFADLDKMLFFGADPFALLYAPGKPEWLLRALELNYSNFWFVICFGMVYWVAVSPRLDGIRVRYFVSFLLTWAIVGNVLATIFSSAGPVYYGHVTGDYTRFAEQVAFLTTTVDEVGSAARYQTYLWDMYVSGNPGLGTGISAFPSMHIALITMNVMFLRELKPAWTPWAWLYTAVLLVSSVYLGWHYAVDGIASIGLGVVIYWAVRKAMSVKWTWRRANAIAVGDEGAAA